MSLVALGGFLKISTTARVVYWTPMCSGVSITRLLSHTDEEILLDYAGTASNRYKLVKIGTTEMLYGFFFSTDPYMFMCQAENF